MNFRLKRTILNICSAILTTMIVFLSLFSFVFLIINLTFIKTPVEGYSMLPTFNSTLPTNVEKGDVIYINRIKKLEVNSVIVAQVEWHKDAPIIKRLVGMPNDRIEIKDENNQYNVYVNNELLYSKEKSDYSLDGIHYCGTNQYFQDYLAYLMEHENGNSFIQLGEDEYFVMGDNWGRTTDSVSKGPIKKSEIIGTVETYEEYGKTNKWYFFKYAIKKFLGVN